MADEFPKWYQPDPTVGSVLVRTQEELDDLQSSKWPKVKKATKVEATATAQDMEHAADEDRPETVKTRKKAE